MKKPNFLFVYGTLRPDDDSGAEWTKPWNEKCKSFKAEVNHAKLYFHEYPVVVLDKSIGGDEDCKNSKVYGYVQTCDTEEQFAKLLKEGDEIEDCPRMYQRTIASVYVYDFKQYVNAWIYFRK